MLNISTYFPLTQQPNAGQGLLIFFKFLDHTHNDTPQSVGLLWASDRPLRRYLYVTTHNTNKTEASMPPAGLFCILLYSVFTSFVLVTLS